MKSFVAVLAIVLMCTPAYAGDAGRTIAPTPPTVAELQAQVAFLSAALQGARQQRDAALSALADLQLQDATAAKIKTPEK